MSVIVSLVLIAGSGLTAAWLGAVGTTRYVDDNTCPAAGSGTLASPYCKIQDAICASVSGDIVSVALGTYLESLRMKPGVSVISQGGAIGTTINAANQPCTDTNFCTKIVGNRCSTVLFGSGHTTATRLEGFTITGGAGREQPSPAQIAGGGIFVFSSATIVNNVITNNVLTGPKSQYNGGGVYVALGAPVISNNTISGNRAVPPAGAAGAVTYGYGGGIFVGFFSDPLITNNVITGNRAGDPNAAYSLGGGGGISLVPGDPNHTGPRIDANLIADNIADSLGGGVGMNSLPGTSALAVVTNNVIVGNSAKNGGGVYTYFNRSNTINNTITGNTAFLGGGMYSGQSETTLPVNITNNVIEGNRLQQFGNGGGLYTFDLSTTFDPAILNNEFWDNERNHVAGDKSDATVIGSNGNLSANPLFVNRAARDFHLDANSPAIDRASATLAPSADKDGLPRGFDGNGIPNNPVAGDVDIGAHEKQGACAPTTEVCDNADNNCNGQIDEGFPDTDSDNTADCVDLDDDNDGADDLSDCQPLDSTAFGIPDEVSNLDVAGIGPSVITYTMQNIGTGTRYEILSGFVHRVATVSGFSEDFCIAANSNNGAWQDQRPAPPADQAWFYLIRSKNTCGNGTLGSPAADQPRGANPCQDGIVDEDNDGSPSDLDCNDNSAAQSPLNTEICDGLDNDCDGPADNNIVDSDGDGQNDCFDANDDDDGAPDVSDCAPLDPTAFGQPVEVQDLDVLGGASTDITWVDLAIGSGTQYVLASGAITTSGTVSFPTAICLGTSPASPATDTRSGGPAPDTTWYYLVKARNGCGQGTFGSAARDTIPICP